MNRNDARFDAILLLGVELGEGDCPTAEMQCRIDEAERAYRAGVSERIVVCGGTTPGHGCAEADVMARELAQRCIPESAILREDQSQDTMENMRFAAKMLGGARGKHVLVVTSDYHMRRSLMTARRVGFKAWGRAAVLEHDEAWQRARREELAYTIDLVMGWQDEGKRRPDWTVTLLHAIFSKKMP